MADEVGMHMFITQVPDDELIKYFIEIFCEWRVLSETRGHEKLAQNRIDILRILLPEIQRRGIVISKHFDELISKNVV